MIFEIIILLIVIPLCFDEDHWVYIPMILIAMIGLMIAYPPSDYYNDYSNITQIDSNYTINCYKATGTFFHPYLKVDCNNPSAELTKNESQSYYYFNTLTNKSCDQMSDCAIPVKSSWWQKWFW